MSNDQRPVRTKGSEINGIWESLQAAEQAEMTRLPENVFAANFVPFFAGEPVPDHINMGTWIGIAGGPFREVMIVNPINGEELFKVPAMFDMDGMRVSDRREISVRDAIQNMMNLSNVSPVRAKAYFEQKMASLGLQQDPALFADKYVDMWNVIFARYNKPLLTTVDKLKEKVAKVAVNRTNTFVDDDDNLL
jgi:hypothetical protein